MPTYEYKCSECAEVFEEFQSMSAPHIEKCKFCGGPVKRLISGGSGLIFKGSGFYITDHRSDTYKKAESSEKIKPISTKKSDSPKKSDSGKKSGSQSAVKTAS